jgi:putative transposase
VILDIFSRRVVGWCVADAETAALFRPLVDDARSFCRAFFDWYNQDHHHAGIGLMTPDQVHYGQADAVHAACQATLAIAFRESPERFVNKPPAPPDKPTAA